MTKQEMVTMVAEKIRASLSSVNIPTVKVPIPRIPKSGKFDEEEFVLIISDIQIGHKTKTFNLNVVLKRGELLIDRLAKITAIHRASHPVRNINIFLLGDKNVVS